jgi:diguanylate cyclase (GGDEF)-like protein
MRATRREELLARVGGEEFAWILPRTGLEDARAAAERARHRLSRDDIPPAGRLTISAGVAELEPGEDPKALMRRADAALYRAKEGGRDRTEAAPPAR